MPLTYNISTPNMLDQKGLIFKKRSPVLSDSKMIHFTF